MNISGAIQCSACPEGGACEIAKLNFTTIPSKPGYWQIKSWFADNGKNWKGEQFHYSRCSEKLRCRNAVKLFDQYFRDFSTDACNVHEATASTENKACSGVQTDIKENCVCQGFAEYSFLDGDGCRLGHNGPYCSTCRNGWVMDSTTKYCSSCENYNKSDNAVSTTAVICAMIAPFVLIALIVFLVFKYHFGLSAMRTYAHVRAVMDSALIVEDEYVGLWGFVVMGSGDSSNLAMERGIPFGDYIIQKLKIIVSLSQVLSQMSVNFSVDWPDGFSRLLESLSFVNLNIFSFPAVGCLAETNFIGIFLAMTSLPLLFAMFIVLCFPLFIALGKTLQKGADTPLSEDDQKTRKKAAHEFALNILIKICLGILFIVYPSVSNIILRMFHCRTLANGEEYLAADLSINCNSNDPISVGPFQTLGYADYRAWAALMLFVYPIGVPVLFYLVLFANRAKLYVKNEADPTKPPKLNPR
jgi:hypothetical protein